uniref:uncharacterized protein LOC104265994 n=1 Tax=Ciona intestinalis TaxID=7719 RepID=UPI000EF552DD|nr:uncharacterized protein LOC104265994 [Ciona intestinalis]|eukprot:XP_009859560.2 uncharacterized protein LOC104265994 [Ciona intestinalis]
MATDRKGESAARTDLQTSEKDEDLAHRKLARHQQDVIVQIERVDEDQNGSDLASNKQTSCAYVNNSFVPDVESSENTKYPSKFYSYSFSPPSERKKYPPRSRHTSGNSKIITTMVLGRSPERSSPWRLDHESQPILDHRKASQAQMDDLDCV